MAQQVAAQHDAASASDPALTRRKRHVPSERLDIKHLSLNL